MPLFEIGQQILNTAGFGNVTVHDVFISTSTGRTVYEVQDEHGQDFVVYPSELDSQ